MSSALVRMLTWPERLTTSVKFTISGHAPDEASLTRMLDALYAESPRTAAWSVVHTGISPQIRLNNALDATER